MKKLKKLMAVVLAVTVAMTMGIASAGMAFAADDNDGSITVTNATAGQTYQAYLLFPASPSDSTDISKGVTYTATEAQTEIEGFTNVFDIMENASGGYTITKKSDVTDDAVIAFVKANFSSLKQGSAINGTFVENTTVEFNNLAYGYYYITSTLGTIVTINTAAKDVEVVDKNESTPTGPDKKITDEDSSVDSALDQNDVELDENDAAVGSVQSFKVSFNATNWVQAEETNVAGTGNKDAKKKALVWHFKDTPTNLSIDSTSVVVTVNGTEISNYTTPTIDDSTGALTFDIPWVDDNQKFLYETKTEGSELIPVVVTYNATVLASAATSPAPNTVEIKYDRTGEQNVDLGNDTTTTYTYKFKVKKVDENNEALEGAEFQLFYGSSTTPLTFTMTDDGKYQYDPQGSVTNIAPVKGTGTDAIAEVIGLDNASYTLKEVVVPEGYTKADDKTVSSLTKEDTGEEAAVTTVDVQNTKGTVLPSTGGMGTTIFYILGALLVIGCGVVLIARRRTSAN